MNFPVVAKEIKLPDSLATAQSNASVVETAVPTYLSEVYEWAYLNPRNVALLDRPAVVDLLLFGNARRLMRSVTQEIKPGQKVLMAAHVYGDFVNKLADAVGPTGQLDIIDIAPIQVANCRKKVGHLSHVNVRQADAADKHDTDYDVVLSFFLLHEVPDGKKRAIVDSLFAALKHSGKGIFVDYHRPHLLHPVRYILEFVNNRLEPFAKSLWRHEISEFSSTAHDRNWRKRTFFGGVYQKVVAEQRR